MFLVLRSATPPFARLAGMMTVKCVLAPRSLVLIMHAFAFEFAREDFSRRGSRLAFGFRTTGLSTRRFHATGFC